MPSSMGSKAVSIRTYIQHNSKKETFYAYAGVMTVGTCSPTPSYINFSQRVSLLRHICVSIHHTWVTYVSYRWALYMRHSYVTVVSSHHHTYVNLRHKYNFRHTFVTFTSQLRHIFVTFTSYVHHIFVTVTSHF